MGRNPFDTYFSGAHFLEDYAEGKSKREITKLLEMNPTTAKLILPDGNTKIVDVSELKVGDQLQVLNGDQFQLMGLFYPVLPQLMNLLLMEKVYRREV